MADQEDTEMIHRMGLTYHELLAIRDLVTEATEKMTDKAFGPNRSIEDVEQAVFLRGLRQKMNDRLFKAANRQVAHDEKR